MTSNVIRVRTLHNSPPLMSLEELGSSIMLQSSSYNCTSSVALAHGSLLHEARTSLHSCSVDAAARVSGLFAQA
jgi:hypothetical protein